MDIKPVLSKLQIFLVHQKIKAEKAILGNKKTDIKAVYGKVEAYVKIVEARSTETSEVIISAST